MFKGAFLCFVLEILENSTERWFWYYVHIQRFCESTDTETEISADNNLLIIPKEKIFHHGPWIRNINSNTVDPA